MPLTAGRLLALLTERRGPADAAEDRSRERLRLLLIWRDCARRGEALCRLDAALDALRRDEAHR